MLQRLFNETKFATVVDYGCGNWELMKVLVVPSHIQYLGIDIVESVVEKNIRLYQKDNIHFLEIDRQEDATHIKGDILIIKDVVMHWPNAEIRQFLEKMLPRYQMAIITNDFCQWHGRPRDITPGHYHCLDLQEPPFSLNAQVLLDWESNRRKQALLWKRDPGDERAMIRGYPE
jgi:SAM-dependent methyltransferase